MYGGHESNVPSQMFRKTSSEKRIFNILKSHWQVRERKLDSFVGEIDRFMIELHELRSQSVSGSENDHNLVTRALGRITR